MKQPHEDIAGTDRTGNDLLSLEPSAQAHRDALIALTRHLHTATLVGNPAPVVQRMCERIYSPQPGDLVVESSAGMHSADPKRRATALGYLVEKRREWWHTDEEWEQYKTEDGFVTDDDRMVDTAWYIQYGPNPGDIFRWVNCSFLVVPVDPDEFDKPFGRRDGSAVVVDRADLLGALADSGITLAGGDRG
jgi:hypothetical protein